MKNTIISLIVIAVILIAVYEVAQYVQIPVENEGVSVEAVQTAGVPAETPDGFMKRIFIQIGAILFLAYLSFYLSKKSKLPIFVTAIALGLIASPFFKEIIPNTNFLNLSVCFCAALILFGGGLETSLKNFMKMLLPILSIAFLGLLITSFLFTVIYNFLNPGVSVLVAVLLGAILASTDPAAIIPTLSILKFKNECVKDLVVSESAVNDVAGTLVTLLFISIITSSGGSELSLVDLYKRVFSVEAMSIFSKQLGIGVLAGLLGYAVLFIFKKFKFRHEGEFAADLAFLFGVPIMTYEIAFLFGGSGFMAVFIAGLFTVKGIIKTNDLEETEIAFNNLIDGFFKPLIFLLLGALVDPVLLLKFAPMGITMALIFMFIIRPIAVFASITPVNWGKDKLSFKDLLFISFVRETGAIPAVLIVITASSLSGKFPGLEPLVPIGMWVILMTLIIQPIFTAKVAQKLGVAELK